MHGRPQQPQRGATRGMPGNKRLKKHQLGLSWLLHIQAGADSAVDCPQILYFVLSSSRSQAKVLTAEDLKKFELKG